MKHYTKTQIARIENGNCLDCGDPERVTKWHCQSCADKAAVRARRWYEANREKGKQRAATWYAKNKERALETRKLWRAKNPGEASRAVNDGASVVRKEQSCFNPK